MDQVSWSYFIRNPKTGALLASEASDLEIDVDSVSLGCWLNFKAHGGQDLYPDVLAMVVRRCLSSKGVFAKFVINDSSNPTLVVRRKMEAVPLQSRIRVMTDQIILKHQGDEHRLVREICNAGDLADRDYGQCKTWHVYVYKRLAHLGSVIHVAEDQLGSGLMRMPKRFGDNAPEWWEKRYGWTVSQRGD